MPAGKTSRARESGATRSRFADVGRLQRAGSPPRLALRRELERAVGAAVERDEIALAPALAKLPSLDRAAQYLADEGPVVDLGAVRDEAQVAVVGGQPGQGIDLDDVDAPVGRQPQVDARDVAAAEGHERRAAHALDGAKLVLREPRGALVSNVALPVLLALVVVDGPAGLSQ